MAKYTINTSDNSAENVFNRNEQEGNIAGTPEVLNARTKKAVADAEVLDRYDDFANMKLTSAIYERQDGVKYGIQRRSEIHGNQDVILDHQVRAARDFLRVLRGFGLLADVVGSGKTFEAGVVLSELATRGKLKSLLLVVPEQVYHNWVEVLEVMFGMGEGTLVDVGREPYFNVNKRKDADPRLDCTLVPLNNRQKNLVRPTRPIIVKTEDFVQWRETDLSNLLFDVVVVDEAHHLCDEDGQYARALKYLSLLMLNKREVNSTYCLLLSATPHSGNLDKMFRLWYFIRCKGGSPEDFDEMEDIRRSEDYRTEKEYYQQVVCRGAHTVSEYISISKLISVKERFGKEFRAYLASLGHESDYDKLTKWEQRNICDDFLAADGNSEIRQKVIADVAGAYHNSVMRSIMIRQPNNLPRKRFVNNLFIAPVEGKFPSSVKADGVTVFPYDIDGPKGVKSSYGDQSLGEYLRNKGQDNNAARAEIWVSGILGGQKVFENGNLFPKKGSQKYYWDQLQAGSENTTTRYAFLNEYGKTDIAKQIFDVKYNELVRILDAHPNDRVILFFDYEKGAENAKRAEWTRVFEALSGTKHKDRIVLGLEDNIEKSTEFFRKNDNAVFVIGDPAYTEGANYQECHIIINFSVTPDPLAMDQRIGRIFRLGQSSDVTIYSFAMMNELEGYALAYFNRIGLLESNSGDATIIAGSNNESMVAVKCPACEKLKLYPRDEFTARKLNNQLYCDENPKCTRNDPRGTVMEEINIYEFKCDRCGKKLVRTDGDAYRCFAINNTQRGSLVNDGKKGNRVYSCSKLCAIRNCSKIRSFKIPCKVINMPDTPISKLKLICNSCENYKSGVCNAKCTLLYDSESDAIKACHGCDHSSCSPKPHSFTFDEKWVAKCPNDRCDGKLRPILARTFAAYIQGAYAFKDDGTSFCKNLGREAERVDLIQKVLKQDAVVKKNY